MSQRLTAKGAATKQRIVEAAASLVRQNGASETNLDSVLAATSTSKSQLFHYWPEGRNGLLLAVADHEADQVLAAQRPYIDDLSTWSVWEEWRKAVMRHYIELGEHCPLGALTSELGNFSPEARSVVSDLYDTWEGALMHGVQALLRGDQTSADLSVRDTARSILTAIQGGVVMLRATGRIAYLETALNSSLQPLRVSSSAA
ncbi:MAG: TetR/AcrR family transcriptional regulator [Hyphomicrobiales bacterium]|nr:MAG: TetR/AcrR family transcriptional regulator [Hyphomicrobiales bacterium]